MTEVRVEAELKRRNTQGDLVPWLLDEQGRSLVHDSSVLSSLVQAVDSLQSILAQLQTTLTTQVNNLPASYPLPDTQVQELKVPPTTEVSNFPLSTEVSNFPASFEVSNHPSEIAINNHPSEIAVNNHPTAIAVNNFPAAFGVSSFPDTSTLHTLVNDIKGLITDQVTKEATLDAARIILQSLQDTKASEATLEAVRVLLNSIQTTRASEATLQSLLNKFNGNETLGYVRDATGLYVTQGLARSAGGVGQTDLNAPNATFSLANPAGSSVNVIVTHFSIFSTSTGVINYHRNFQSHAGTIVEAFNPNLGATATPTVAVARAGTATIMNSTQISPSARITAEHPYIQETMIILPPGHNIAAHISGSATGAVVRMNASWLEMPI